MLKKTTTGTNSKDKKELILKITNKVDEISNKDHNIEMKHAERVNKRIQKQHKEVSLFKLQLDDL